MDSGGTSRATDQQETHGIDGIDGADAEPRGRGPFGSEMPLWIVASLVTIAIPRTVLTDIGVLEPEGSLLYYLLALGPYAVWLAVAVMRKTWTPLRDHLLVGALYGFSLILVHELFWKLESSQAQNPPAGVSEFAAGFEEPMNEIVIHLGEFGIAMMIGVGSGGVMAAIAFVANRIRRARVRRSRRDRVGRQQAERL